MNKPPKFTVICTHKNGRVTWHRTESSLRGSCAMIIYLIGQPSQRTASGRAFGPTLAQLENQGAKLTQL